MLKRISCLFVLLLFVCSFGNISVFAVPLPLKAGMAVSAINEAEINEMGYKFVDDTDPGIQYEWPYTLNSRPECAGAYGGHVLSALGQVSPKITYNFEGTFLAVAFAETYYAATVKVDVDGEMLAEVTPHSDVYITDGGDGSIPMRSIIIFATDELSPGSHTVTISHEAGHASGEDHVLADGNAYYDNYAYFDCFIVEDTQAEEPSVEKVTKGSIMSDYTDDILNSMNLTVIDDTNENIRYQWPYDLGIRLTSLSAYGGSVLSNAGQVSAAFSYDFEGTFLAVAFAETYYAATVKIIVDGEMLAEVTPHYDVYVSDGGDGSLPMRSSIIFVTDELSPGPHTVIISHEAGHESGDDHVLSDGNAYYDNYALFDCLIVQKNPTEPDPAKKVTEGSLMSGYTEDALNKLNLTVIDDTNEEIQYQSPYDMNIRFACATAYGGSVLSNVGQVSATFSYDFEGTFLAVAFAETYYAATVRIAVDGEMLAEVTPHSSIYVSDGGDGSLPMRSSIIFVTDELSPGSHTVTIYHEAGHESGDDHVLSDGNAYYDNYALFDCLIVQKNPTEPEPVPVDKVTEGSLMSDYTEDVLNKLNLTVIDDTNEKIQYQWPYDLNKHYNCTSAYGGSVLSNEGQVSATFSYDFEGTFLAVAFAETYYSATVKIVVDGKLLAEVTPHHDTYVSDGGNGSLPMRSTIIFATDKLSPGSHTVTISHEAGHESGEDHVLFDGTGYTAYYDNYALFDCLLVQKNPTKPAPENTPEPGEEAPITGDTTNIAVACCIIAATMAALFVIIKRKSEG